MNTVLLLVTALLASTSAVMAGSVGATPELDSTTLTSVVSGIAGVYVVYRLYSQSRKK